MENADKKYIDNLSDRLSDLFQIYLKRFSDKQMIFQAMSEANNLRSINELRTAYMKNMNEFLSQDNVSLDHLQIEHLKNRADVIRTFESSKLEGDKSFEKYLYLLIKNIDEVFLIYYRQLSTYKNSWKTTFKEICLPIIETISQAFIIAYFPNLRFQDKGKENKKSK